VPPEQRKLLRAIARSLPWALAAIAATGALCIALDAPRWLTSILVPLVALAAPLAYARDELRLAGGGASRSAMAVAAAHVGFPLVGVPLAIEGLRSHRDLLAVVGTTLLALVVVDSAVVLPWITARRQRRSRAR
jgi:hypothetical protein